MRLGERLLAAALLLASVAVANAQADYPAQRITIVAVAAAGGSVDAIARVTRRSCRNAGAVRSWSRTARARLATWRRR